MKTKILYVIIGVFITSISACTTKYVDYNSALSRIWANTKMPRDYPSGEKVYTSGDTVYTYSTIFIRGSKGYRNKAALRLLSMYHDTKIVDLKFENVSGILTPDIWLIEADGQFHELQTNLRDPTEKEKQDVLKAYRVFDSKSK